MTQLLDPEACAVDTRITVGEYIFAEIDVSGGPWFSLKEMTTVFFGRTTNWLRFQEKKGNLVLDGVPVGTTRETVARSTGVDPVGHGRRQYNLADIEKIAYALLLKKIIDPHRWMMTMVMVKIQAQLHGYIKP